jgi:hypothetical protein
VEILEHRLHSGAGADSLGAPETLLYHSHGAQG